MGEEKRDTRGLRSGSCALDVLVPTGRGVTSTLTRGEALKVKGGVQAAPPVHPIR